MLILPAAAGPFAATILDRLCHNAHRPAIA